MEELETYFNKKKRDKSAVLTLYEKKIAKALKNKNVREQDILYLLNIGRKSTLNSGRLSEIDWDTIQPCSDDELKFFEKKQQSWDFSTGLNPFANKIDCILVKSKEAMLQAVSAFNSPSTYFSLENFLVLANIAWLYLFQAYCEREKIEYHKTNGQTQVLSYMIEDNEDFLNSVNLSASVRSNIQFLIGMRDSVTHDGCYEIPSKIITKLQANCFNYNDMVISLFGERNSLKNIFSIALQFSNFSLNQSKQLISNKTASNKNLLNFVENFEKSLSPDVLNDIKYQFSITYVLVNNNKANLSDAVKFYAPGTEDYENIERVLIKEVFGFDRYKYTITKIQEELEKIDNTQKYRNKLLDLIERHNLRDCKHKKSQNVRLVQAFPSGNKGTTWKYTEEFLDLCKKELLGTKHDA